MAGLELANGVDHDRTFLARIDRDLTQRLFESAPQDPHTDCLVTKRLDLVQRRDSVDEN